MCRFLKGHKMTLCKREISSPKLILIISVYFSSVLNFSFWRYVFQNFDVTDFKSTLFALSLIFFIFIPLFMLFNLVFTKKIGRIITIILLLCSSIANYYMAAFNVYIDSDMVRNIAETNFSEAYEHISISFWLTFILTGVLPAFLIAKVKVIQAPFKQELKQRLKNILIAFLILALFALFCFKQYAVIGRNHNDITKLMNTFNYPYAVIRYHQKKAKAARKLQILDENPVLQSANQKNLIVLIIGETARAQNFSLNGYAHDTNPKLAKQDIVNFSNVSSCGTLTAVSLPCMFSVFSKDDFDTDDAAFVQNALDMAQTAGYKVIWAENDSGCKGVCNRVEQVDLSTFKTPAMCQEGFCYDEILLQYLKQELPKISDNTILVLHTIGSHGPAYYRRYPKKFDVFKPTCDTTDIQNCSQEAITNTYDNTILYSDYIISSAIDLLKTKTNPDLSASLIYISDHGESLGENGTYLHGLPYAIAPEYQTKVPMLMWLSPQKQAQIDYACLKKQAASQAFSHDNFFHTLLGLAGVSSKTYLPQSDILSSCVR